MRKGFRVSVSNANQLYRFRAMVSYASGQLDNGWSYAFSFGTRQGGNGYVDGIYYNAYSYFASAEKPVSYTHLDVYKRQTEDLFTVSTEYTKTTIDQLGEGNYEIEDATIVGVHQKAVMFAQENSGTVNYVLAFENNWQDQTANPYIGAVGKTATVKGEIDVYKRQV